MSKRKARPRAPEPSSARAQPAPPPPAPLRLALPPRGIVAALAVLYALVYGFIVWTKYRYYLYIDFDLAIFVQATDQALRGSLFSSIRGMNWLGDHVSLILFVIAPLYAIVRHPLTLLFLQTAVLALGAWPVFSLARRELRHEGVAAALAAVYLLYPAIGYTNLFEFHPEVLATTTLLATMAGMAADRFVPTLVFATLSLLCKEDVALIVFMLGLAALLPGRPRRLLYAGSLAGLALVSLSLSFLVILPRLGSTAAEYGKMYRDWGTGMGQVALHLVTHPLQAIAAFYDTPGNPFDTEVKRSYWPMMLGPLLFLPLLSPLGFAVALPVLAEHFLSYRRQQHGLLYQYTALVTPVFVAATVRGFGNLTRILTRRPITEETLRRPGTRRLMAAIALLTLLASVASNLFFGPLLRREGWFRMEPRSEGIRPDARDLAQKPYRDRIVAQVPRSGAVVASFEYLARFASRPAIHSLHHIYTGFFTFSSRPYPLPTDAVAFLADMSDPRLATYVVPSTPLRLRELMAVNDLRPVEADGDLLLLKRAARDTVELLHAGAPAAPVARHVTYDRQLAFTGFALPQPTVEPGALLPLQTFWRRTAPADRQFAMQLVMRNERGETVFVLARHLGYLFYPVSEWPLEVPVRESYRLVIPRYLTPGTYELGLRVAWWRGEQSGLSQPDDTTLAANRLAVPLGAFTIVSAAR